MSTEMVQVNVPEGMVGGQQLTIQTPSGGTATVTIPEGLQAGMTFQANVPAAPVVVTATVMSNAVAPAQQPAGPPPVAEKTKCHCCSLVAAGVGLGCLFLSFVIMIVASAMDSLAIFFLTLVSANILLLAGMITTSVGGGCLAKQGQTYRKQRGSFGLKKWRITGFFTMGLMIIVGLIDIALVFALEVYSWYYWAVPLFFGIFSTINFAIDAKASRMGP